MALPLETDIAVMAIMRLCFLLQEELSFGQASVRYHCEIFFCSFEFSVKVRTV
jgi:hypothetical protein